jgi:DNA-binding transcriptional regulator of glucitol operon
MPFTRAAPASILLLAVAFCGQVMMSVGQLSRLADGSTKLSHQRPVE